MREWIITNGIGGFASSTDLGGMNARRYHGLLIASLVPPRNRTLILSKVDESIEINGKKYNLYTNDVEGKIFSGYKYLKKFEKEILPIYTFEVNNVIVEKTICMIHKKNAVVIMYKVMNINAKTKLQLTPIVNFRDFHSENHSNNISFNQTTMKDKTQIDLSQDVKVNIGVQGSSYLKYENNMFINMHYQKEEERGFDCLENHFVPGTFEVELKPNEDKTITFVCALDDKYGINFSKINSINPEAIIKSEKERIDTLIKDSKLNYSKKKLKLNDTININGESDYKYEEQNYINFEDKEIYQDLVKKYIIATDNFVVQRAENKLHTIIAGYPWFLDWGRDAFISFEGLVLITKRYDIAKEVLMTFANQIKEGIIPNGFSEYDGSSMYNSVDSSLLFINSAFLYAKYTNDYEFINKKLYKKMETIISNYVEGTNLDGNNIYLDKNDYLLNSGTSETQNTWMDAKVNGRAITPRSGKAVEINAMWYNALKIMEELSKKFQKKSQVYTELAEKCKKSFEKYFYNNRKKCLFDVVDIKNENDYIFQNNNHNNNHNNNQLENRTIIEMNNDDKIRPNQLFALSMPFPVLNCSEQIAKKVFITATEKLLNKFGLQTLAKKEYDYSPIYKGNPVERDLIYHQGITWPWLLGIYYDAFKNIIKSEKNENIKTKLETNLMQFRIKIACTFVNELTNGNTIGSISEIYDSKNAKNGKGAFAQAWSVSEVFRIIFDKY